MFGDTAWSRDRKDGRTDGDTGKLEPISPRFMGDNKQTKPQKTLLLRLPQYIHKDRGCQAVIKVCYTQQINLILLSLNK